MAASYEYDARLIPGTQTGLDIVNRLGAEGWKVTQVLPLHSCIGEVIGTGSLEVLVIFERVLDRDFEHLMVALETLLTNITINTSQD